MAEYDKFLKAEALKAVLKEEGWNKTEAAEKLNTRREYFSKWVSAQKDIPQETWDQIEQMFEALPKTVRSAAETDAQHNRDTSCRVENAQGGKVIARVEEVCLLLAEEENEIDYIWIVEIDPPVEDFGYIYAGPFFDLVPDNVDPGLMTHEEANKILMDELIPKLKDAKPQGFSEAGPYANSLWYYVHLGGDYYAVFASATGVGKQTAVDAIRNFLKSHLDLLKKRVSIGT